MDKIVKKRKAENMSQQELADRAGISRKTLSAYETGKARPTHSMKEKLRKILDIREPVELIRTQEQIEELSSRYSLSARDFQLMGQLLDLIYHFPARLEQKSAEELLDFLMDRKHYQKDLIRSAKRLDAFDRKYVFNHKNYVSSGAVFTALNDKGEEVPVPKTFGGSYPNWEKIEQEESRWTSLIMIDLIQSQLIIRITEHLYASDRNFFFDYLRHTPHQDLRERYGCAEPREKMVKILRDMTK